MSKTEIIRLRCSQELKQYIAKQAEQTISKTEASYVENVLIRDMKKNQKRTNSHIYSSIGVTKPNGDTIYPYDLGSLDRAMEITEILINQEGFPLEKACGFTGICVKDYKKYIDEQEVQEQEITDSINNMLK